MKNTIKFFLIGLNIITLLILCFYIIQNHKIKKNNNNKLVSIVEVPNFIIYGDTLRAQISIGYIDTTFNGQIFLENGDTLELKNGKATYLQTEYEKSVNNFSGGISASNKSKKIELKFDNEFKPIQISNFFRTYNEPKLYLGCENRISFFYPEIESDSIIISIDNGKIFKLVDYIYVADLKDVKMPKKDIKIDISILNNGKIKYFASQYFQPMHLPLPEYRISYVENNCISIKKLKLNEGFNISCLIYDSSIDIPCQVLSFNIIASINGVEKEMSTEKGITNYKQLEILSQLKIGQHLIVNEVKAQMPDSTIVELPPSVLKVVE